MRKFLALLLYASSLGALGAETLAAQRSQLTLELEAGPVWQGYNDVEIPNDGSATRFSLSDLVGDGPGLAARAYLTWSLSDRQSLRLLVAPLSLTGSGVPKSPIIFSGSGYAGGSPVRATYRFNSYRLTYRWRVHSGARSDTWLGVTAKVRDASIQLEQGPLSGRKDDLGFVPLIHVSSEWRFASRLSIALDADALAGGPGRAVDASLKVGYDVGDRWSVRAGYRGLEGGADVPDVYAFAWLHYATASMVWRW